MSPVPLVIGLAGPSGAGKTTLARCLAAQLSGASILSLDSYYRDYARLSPGEKARFNFDAPEAMDHLLLAAHLGDLARGQAVEKPVYDFATHSRLARTEIFRPGNALIVEGLFALYWEEIRVLYDLSVFIDADDDLCLERRLARDLAERGRTRESVLEQYRTQVRPMAERHVRPTARFADVMVSGQAPVEEMASLLIARLGRSLP